MPQPPVAPEGGEEVPVREQFPENSIADKLFSDEPFEQREEPAKEESPAEKPAAPKKEASKEEPAPTGDEDDEEVDWESPDEPGKAEEPDLEDEPKDETEARKQARLRGREAKRLKAEMEELRLEKERLAEERENYRKKVEEYEASTVDPTQHPDFTALRNDILNDVSNAAELMPVTDPELVVSNFGTFMSKYLALDGLPAKERTEKLNELRGVIVDTIVSSDIPYNEMSRDEQAEYARLTSDVLSVVQRNVRATRQLGELKASLENKAKSGVILKGVREYEAQVEEFKPVLDTIGELPEDVVEADPHSPASVVATMIRKNPEAKKKIEKAKRDVLDAILGPRPLTFDEVKRLESNGTDVKKFLAERDTRHKELRKKLIPLLVQGLVTRSTFKTVNAELAKLRAKEGVEENELDVLREVGGKKPFKDVPAEKPKVSIVERLLSDE